jgi:hypothetical protein
MSNTHLDFSYKMEGIDRKALLTEAAKLLDKRRGPLGGSEVKVETPEGEQARALLDDVAEFAGFPEVYKITDKDFLSRNFKVPVRFSQLAKTYNFYWLYFPTILFPRYNWAFHKLEIEIKLKSGNPAPHLQPKAYQILPAQQFQTLLRAESRLEVRLDENFEFAARTGPLEGKLGQTGGKIDASADAKAATRLGLVAGPFVYRIKKAKIQHTTTGAERVFWRLDGAEFFQEDAPALIIIAQVPKEIKEVKIDANMLAYRYFNLASATLQQAIKELPELIRNFFMGGLPIGKPASWDITPVLQV